MFMNMRQDTLKSYLMVILCWMILIASIGVLAYIIDLVSLHGDIDFIVVVLFTIVGSFYIRRWVRIISKEYARKVAYFIFGIGGAVSSFLLLNIIHEQKHPMIEVGTMQEAIDSGEEYFHVKNIEIDTSRHGEYISRRLVHMRYRTEIEYVLYVAYRIKDTKNGYWGYAKYSDQMSLNDNEKRDAFIASKNKLIKNHPIPSGERYFRRMMPNKSEYFNYAESCIDTSGYIATSPVVFIEQETSNKELLYSNLNSIFIFLLATMFLEFLVFFCAKKKKTLKAVDTDIKKERSKVIDYVCDKKNWYVISLFVLLVGYFFIILSNDIHAMMGGDVQTGELLQWGALTKKFCVDLGEWWRLITAPFVPLCFDLLLLHLIIFILFVGFNHSVSHSWILWFVFMSTSVMSNVAFIVLKPHDITMGCISGIMGLYGFCLACRFDMYKQRDVARKRKKKKQSLLNILHNLIKIQGVNGIVVIFVFLICLFTGFAEFESTMGLLFGILIWYVVKSNLPAENLQELVDDYT